MENKQNEQCKKCEWYNSLACPYAGSSWEDGDICDEYRQEVKEDI